MDLHFFSYFTPTSSVKMLNENVLFIPPQCSLCKQWNCVFRQLLTVRKASSQIKSPLCVFNLSWKNSPRVALQGILLNSNKWCDSFKWSTPKLLSGRGKSWRTIAAIKTDISPRVCHKRYQAVKGIEPASRRHLLVSEATIKVVITRAAAAALPSSADVTCDQAGALQGCQRSNWNIRLTWEIYMMLHCCQKCYYVWFIWSDGVKSCR